jgi:hypothetical protein
VSDVQVSAQQEIDHDREELVAAACHLVASDNGVRSVRVLLPSRPAFDELRCYQEWARGQHVLLSVDGKGVVTVRSERDTQG